MTKSLLGLLAGLVLGFFLSQSFGRAHASNYYDVRLVEIINLVMALGISGYIAYAFARALSHGTKKKELLASSFGSLGSEYRGFFLQLDDFMDGPSSVAPKLILLGFKGLSSRLFVLEAICRKLKLSEALVMNIRDAHSKLDKVVTGSNWCVPPKKVSYTDSQRDEAKKEMQALSRFIEETQLSLFD